MCVCVETFSPSVIDDTSKVEKEDEQPTVVVVLKAGDIGPEEFKAYRQEMSMCHISVIWGSGV